MLSDVKYLDNNLTFTSDVSFAIDSAHIIIIAVNTPAGKSVQGLGCPTNMSAFFSVVEAISISLRKLNRPHKIIIEKSTVPLGTAS